MDKRYSTQKTASFNDARMMSGLSLSNNQKPKPVVDTPLLIDDNEEDCSSSSRSCSISERKSFTQEYEVDDDPFDTSIPKLGAYHLDKEYFKLSVYPQHILKALIGNQRWREASLEHFVKIQRQRYKTKVDVEDSMLTGQFNCGNNSAMIL